MTRSAAVASFALALVTPFAASAEPLDCKRELAEVRRVFQDHASSRARFAAPLTQTVKYLIDRTLTDDDQVLVQAFARGRASAADVDRALWPKLRPAFERFNRAGCRDLGGVVAAEDAKTDVVAARRGESLHTGVLVTCAREPMQGEARRYLGLRVRRSDAGTHVELYGFVQTRVTADGAREPEWSGIVVEVPLGDRARAGAQLEEALASYTGNEADFTWAVPAACKERVTVAP